MKILKIKLSINIFVKSINVMRNFRQPTSGGTPGPVTRSPSAGALRAPGRAPIPGKKPTGSRPGGLSARLGGFLFNTTTDSSGLKVGPTFVLIGSLIFIAFVVLLHIWGKFSRR